MTNLPHTPAHVYALYCARGDMENRLKELHHGLELDRTSCSRFMANQFRVLLTAAAYVLFQDLQRRAHGTACAGAQVTTLRERLLKVAVWIERSVRRIVLLLPTAFPWLLTAAHVSLPHARRTLPVAVPLGHHRSHVPNGQPDVASSGSNSRLRAPAAGLAITVGLHE